MSQERVIEKGTPIFIGGGQGSGRVSRPIKVEDFRLLADSYPDKPYQSSMTEAFSKQQERGGGVTNYIE